MIADRRQVISRPISPSRSNALTWQATSAPSRSICLDDIMAPAGANQPAPSPLFALDIRLRETVGSHHAIEPAADRAADERRDPEQPKLFQGKPPHDQRRAGTA